MISLKNNDWWKGELNGKVGWCQSRYLSSESLTNEEIELMNEIKKGNLIEVKKLISEINLKNYSDNWVKFF